MMRDPNALTIVEASFRLFTGLWLTNSLRSDGEERVCSSLARWTSALMPSASACPSNILEATLLPKATVNDPIIPSAAEWAIAARSSAMSLNDIEGRHSMKSVTTSLQ